MGKINNKCKLGREREGEVRFLVNKTNRYNDKDQQALKSIHPLLGRCALMARL